MKHPELSELLRAREALKSAYGECRSEAWLTLLMLALEEPEPVLEQHVD